MNTKVVTDAEKHIRSAPFLITAVFMIAIAICCGCSGKDVINTPPPSDATADIVTLSPSDISLSLGERYGFAVSVLPEGAAADGIWSVDSPDNALILSGSDIIAVNAGEAKVSFTLPNGVTDTAGVTVTDNCREKLTALLQNANSTSLYSDFTALRTSLDGCGGDAPVVCRFIDGLFSSALGDSKISELEPLCESSGLGIDFETARRCTEAICGQSQLGSDTMTFSFVGDCTLADRNDENYLNYFPRVFSKQSSPTYPADNIMHWFYADDFTLINHEAAISDYIPHAPKKINFRSKPEYASIFAASSVEGATLANNHTYDYKEKGFEDTLECLHSLGIETADCYSPLVTTVNGVEVVVIAAGAHGEFDKIEVTHKLVLDYIAQYKKPDNLVIVALHWGDEYNKIPYNYQIDSAHDFIDAGADIIIGHHPHIIQGIEMYNGHIIAYSLGNFMYSGLAWSREPQTFILRVTFGTDDTGAPVLANWSIVPCLVSGTRNLNNNYQPVTLYGEEAETMASMLLERSAALPYGIDEVDYLS